VTRRNAHRLLAWARKPTTARRACILLVASGFGALRHFLEDVDRRLEALEGRGHVPLDDVATLADLGRHRLELEELIAGKAGGPPAGEE
jgi:hypothetical protein